MLLYYARHLHGSRESGVNNALFRVIYCALDFIVVERKLSGKGTVQASLAEGCPNFLHHDLPTPVVFADPCYPRVHFLRKIVFVRAKEDGMCSLLYWQRIVFVK